MKDMFREAAAVPSGCPATVTSPSSARWIPLRTLMRVDFPAPLGPRSARTLPLWMSRSTASRARVPPKRLLRPRMRTRGSAPKNVGALTEVSAGESGRHARTLRGRHAPDETHYRHCRYACWARHATLWRVDGAFDPDDLAAGGVARAPGPGELRDQEQATAALVGGGRPAQMRGGAAGVGDLADQGAAVEQTHLDGPAAVPDGVGDQLAEQQLRDERGLVQPPVGQLPGGRAATSPTRAGSAGRSQVAIRSASRAWVRATSRAMSSLRGGRAPWCPGPLSQVSSGRRSGRARDRAAGRATSMSGCRSSMSPSV